MNKTNKRYMNLRNKLFAAIAMLLVSSIMMVSSTYAWFTLSTAPEVQGITTTVGSNGSLEIALSPLDGNYNVIGSHVGDSNSEWTVKNTTWGNLLNLSSAEYELSSITLMPSGINMSNSEIDAENSPLKRPAYGSDGRISELKADTIIGVKQNEGTNDNVDLSTGFQQLMEGAATPGYGVRAIGTASDMSTHQRIFNAGLSAMRSGMRNAAKLASESLSANGDALANIMVTYAMDDDNSANYVDHVPALRNLVAALDSSLAEIDNALKGAVQALAATHITDAKVLEEFVASLKDADMGTFELKQGETSLDRNGQFAALQSKRNAIANRITAAAGKLPAEGASNVAWGDLTAVMSDLMNTENITINDETVDYVSEHYTDMISDLIKNVAIKLHPGSGIYYDIHEIAAKIQTGVEVSIDPSGIIDGMKPVSVPATIETVLASGTTPALEQAVAAIGQIPPATDTNASSAPKLDVYYGYILDFVFRTNAANSYLQLQSDATNRVYQEGGSDQTQGAGSTVSFTAPANATDATVISMTEAIRVVFFDTASGEVYGIAKVGAVSTTETTDESGAVVKTMTGTLKLYEHDASGTLNGEKTNSATTTNDDSVALCALDQNVAKRVSVLVYLDGNNITNANIIAEGSMTGTLNLQFSSSAPLAPMENSELRDGTTGN